MKLTLSPKTWGIAFALHLLSLILLEAIIDAVMGLGWFNAMVPPIVKTGFILIPWITWSTYAVRRSQ